MSNEYITLIGRLSLIPIILLYIFTGMYRIWKNWDKSSERIIKLIVFSKILMLVSILSAIPKPVTLYTDISRIVSLHYCMFLVYITAKHLSENKTFTSILRDPLFAITNTITLFVIFIESQRSDFGIITDNDVVVVDFLYLVSGITSYAFLAITSIIIVILLYKSVISNNSPEYRIRIFLSIVSFLFIAICALSVIPNLILVYYGNSSYRNILNIVYHFGKLIYFPLALMGIILPDGIIHYLAKPIYKIRENKISQDMQDIKYLHEKITSIVPSVKLEYDQPQIDDMMVEIADARMILWTHLQIEELPDFSPKSEAEIIRDVNDKKFVIGQTAKHLSFHPPIDELKHNLSVARHLRSKQ